MYYFSFMMKSNAERGQVKIKWLRLASIAVLGFYLAGCTTNTPNGLILKEPQYFSSIPYPVYKHTPENRVFKDIEPYSTDCPVIMPSQSGNKPVVIVMHELTGLNVINLRMVHCLSKYFTVYTSKLFGGYAQDSLAKGLFFNLTHNVARFSKINKLVDLVSAEEKNAPITVVGMCMTGAIPLLALRNPNVKSIVMAQPTMPLWTTYPFNLLVPEKLQQQLGLPNESEVLDLAIERIKGDVNKAYMLLTRYKQDKVASYAKHVKLVDSFKDSEQGNPRFYEIQISKDEARQKEGNHSSLTRQFKEESNGEIQTHPSHALLKEVMAFIDAPESFGPAVNLVD